jgi:hypothetical protein
MNRDEQLIETVRQFNEGAITATEMLNKIFQRLGDEATEFWREVEETRRAWFSDRFMVSLRPGIGV